MLKLNGEGKFHRLIIIVENRLRHKRLRLLIKKLNRKRKKQAQKIDILCNDFVQAQRDFIKNLKAISFIANFYESIVGITDLNKLLYTATKIIKEEDANLSVTFFLRQSDNYELYMFECEQPITFEKQHLEDCFSIEVMDNICKSNKVCTLEDMFAMGLQGNLVGFNKISGVTIPLTLYGSSLGFVWVYCPSENGLTDEKIDDISSITCGLSRAIKSCQTILHSTD